MAVDPAKDRVQAQFGAAALDYVSSDVHARGESLEVLLAETRPRAEWEALDIATGAGHCALAFAARVRRIVALDLTGPMLEAASRLAAERGLRNLETRAGDAEALPFSDGIFDLVTCRLAFHHFPRPALAASEFSRVLRPGGMLGFSDNITVADRAAADHYNAFETLRDPSHHRVLPLADLVRVLEGAGLHVLSTRRLTKEFELQAWADRQRVSAPDKARLSDMLRSMPPLLAPLLAPRWADGTVYFTLWEAVVVARKP